MQIYQILTLAVLACIGHVQAFIITAASESAAVTPFAAVITPADLKRVNAPVQSTFITSTIANQAPISASITAPPTSTAYVIRRQTQKCFNDQGFQVDCATWTGYYCKCLEKPNDQRQVRLTCGKDSWGPPGNPYEGGPGDGQWDGNSGSGSDGGNGLLFQSTASSFDQLSATLIAGVCFLIMAVLL